MEMHGRTQEDWERGKAGEPPLRELVASIPAMMGVVEIVRGDADILHVYDSPATERFFGQGSGSTVGKTASEMGVPEEAIAIWVARYRESERLNAPVRFEYPHSTNDGEVWLSAVVAPLQADGSGARHFSYVTEDVSARKEVDDRVRRNESRWRFLARLSDSMRSGRDSTTIASQACELLAVKMDLSRCTYASVELSHDRATVRAEFARAVPSLIGEHRPSDYGTELWERSQRGQTTAVEDVRDDPLASGHQTAYAGIGTRSFVHAPILRDGSLVAFFDAHSDVPRSWSEEEIRLVQDVAARLWEAVQRSDSEEALRRANVRLETLAATDFLTGLWNARVFHERLHEEWSEARRLGRPLSLALLDLDDFKGFNDAFGHPAGDQALRTAAAIVRGETRDYDVAARLGGEEFALLMPSTDEDQACRVAERVRGAVASGPWTLRKVTTSIGIATLKAGMECSEELFQAADRALYVAKGSGRNQVGSSNGEEGRGTSSSL